ncbi:MAG: FGGY-family carbohydrate kinase [Lachnospiraceae bacterium]|jgi:sugar (pentulose or hexulose) kinase|nr:FGGY-family carbohydrate kinase [Lachnospiraceae bacterium]
MRDIILVSDFGTSNVRCVAIDAADGVTVQSASRKYAVHSPQEGYMEIDPEEIWANAVACVGEVKGLLSGGDAVKALNFTFFGSTLFVLDENHKPLTNCILLWDKRSEAESKELVEKLSTPKFEFTKLSPASKILYYKRGGQLPTARHWWSIQQFVLQRLGLRPVWDPTMANSHHLYSVSEGAWNQSFLDAIGISVDELCAEFVTAQEPVGVIDHFGDVDLGGGVTVFAGGHDSDVGIFGLGIMDEADDVIGEAAGTYDHVGFLANETPERTLPAKAAAGPLKGTRVCMRGFSYYGAVVEWFMRELGGGTSAEAYGDMWSHCTFDGTPGGVKLNPAFMGDGALTGLGLSVTKYDIFRCIIETLTFETRKLVDTALKIKQNGCGRIRVGGGPAKADGWVQLRADVTGLTVERLVNYDISALGAAVLAAGGVGVYPSLREALDHMVRIKDSFAPDPERHARYEERYKEYLERGRR